MSVYLDNKYNDSDKKNSTGEIDNLIHNHIWWYKLIMYKRKLKQNYYTEEYKKPIYQIIHVRLRKLIRLKHKLLLIKSINVENA